MSEVWLPQLIGQFEAEWINQHPHFVGRDQPGQRFLPLVACFEGFDLHVGAILPAITNTAALGCMSHSTK